LGQKVSFSLDQNLTKIFAQKIKYNFNTATHGGLKNEIFEFYFCQGGSVTGLKGVKKVL
jgi:hypothetical protein